MTDSEINLNFSEKGLELVSPPHFVYGFSRKVFFMLHSMNWPNFIVWLPLLHEILDYMCITIIYWPGYDVMKFEINLTFLTMPFYYMTKKKVKTKTEISWERKELLGWNKNHFSSLLKGFQLLKISQTWEYAFEDENCF